jgi:hypothetical protein
MTYQAWFKVECNGKTSMAGLTVDSKKIDGEAHAKFLEKDFTARGRVMTVTFVCVADHLTYQHNDFPSVVRAVDYLQ